jgi:hypothetical protein
MWKEDTAYLLSNHPSHEIDSRCEKGYVHKNRLKSPRAYESIINVDDFELVDNHVIGTLKEVGLEPRHDERIISCYTSDGFDTKWLVIQFLWPSASWFGNPQATCLHLHTRHSPAGYPKDPRRHCQAVLQRCGWCSRQWPRTPPG